MSAGCPFLLLNNSENHLYPQRKRPTEQSLAPTHSCLILRAGRSQLSFQSRVRSRAVSQHVRAWDSQGTNCLLGPPAITPFPPGQGLQTKVGSGWQGSYTHREGSPDEQSSLPESHPQSRPTHRADPEELPGSPARSS